MIVAAVFLVLGLGALALPIGSISRPGPGLWPLLTSVLGILVTTAAIVETFLTTSNDSQTHFDGIHWTRFFLFFVFTIAFLFIYPFTGFLVSAAILMILLLKFVADVGWKMSIVTALISSTSLYAIFTQLLNVRL